jgi:hypothetical protein
MSISNKPLLNDEPDDDADAQVTDARTSNIKRGWLYILMFLAMLPITVGILTAVYRQMPKKSAIVKKRKIPATNAVFVSVMSTVDSTHAQRIIGTIAQEIGADSTYTKMTVGSTAIFKQCTSLDDYKNVLREGLLYSKDNDLKKQAVLMSHVAGVITTDTLPTKLYLVGKLDAHEYEKVQRRMEMMAGVLRSRSDLLGRVGVIAYIPEGKDREQDSIRKLVLDNFRRVQIPVEERVY